MRRASIRPARAFIGGSGGAVNGPEPRPLTTCRPPCARFNEDQAALCDVPPAPFADKRHWRTIGTRAAG